MAFSLSYAWIKNLVNTLIKQITLFIFSFCCCVQLNAQPAANAILYTITEKNGLTDNNANCFFKDSDGIMWIGTTYGLNSFDGSVVKNFLHNNTETSIASNVVYDIKEDGKRNLWIATGNGLSCYSLTSHSFRNYKHNDKDAVLNRFYSLAIQDKMIYLATEEGLAIFNTENNRFTFHKSQNKNASRITKIFIDRRQRIWLCSYDGLWLYNKDSATFSSYVNSSNDNMYDGLVTDILEDHAGQLWFGNWSKGLKKLDPQTKTVQHFSAFKGSNGNVTSLAEQKNPDGSYSLWQGSNICKPDLRTKSFSYLYNNDKPVISNKIYCDADNLLWISTSDGIKIYNPEKQYFQTNILSPFQPLTTQGIALFSLKTGFLLGGEDRSSLLLFSDSLKQLENLSAKTNIRAAVMAIQKDIENNYWLSTSNGLYMFDSSFSKGQAFLHESKDKASLPNNFINGVLFKKDGGVWVFPWMRGIRRFDKTTKKFYSITTIKGDSLFPKNNFSSALEDKQGNIWLTDYNAGLFKYNPATGEIKNPVIERRLTNAYIINDKLYTVSASEIFVADIATNKIETYYLPQGKNKYEYDFIPDNNDWLWIAGKNGLLAFNMQTKQFKTFTKDDGLHDDNLEITFSALSNGNIIMAGPTYITTFPPSIVQRETTGPSLLFTGAYVNETAKISEKNTLHLSWNEKNVQLNWALLNFSNPLGNIYYYKLDKINSDWQTSGNKGSFSFNSLEPGSYLFHYKASSSDGIMSAEKTLQIIVHPPFWKTWWFILLTLLVIAAIFYSVVKYISQRNLKEKLLRLEKEQAIEKERNRISRDMHDDLGSGLTKIAILTEVIKKQPAANETNINKISETARDLVDSLDEMVWALNPQNDSLDKLSAYIAEYMNQFLDSTDIVALVELPENIIPVNIGEEKRRNIFMTVKEFLNNTVKHSHAKTVSMQLIQHDGAFEIILKDDGKGIDNAGNNMGNGLKNMQQRINDIGGTAAFRSVPGEGTELKIYCPA